MGTIQHRILEQVLETPKTCRQIQKALSEDNGEEYVRHMVYKMFQEGSLIRIGDENGVPTYTMASPPPPPELEIWSPHISHHIRWPNASQMRDLKMYSGQFNARGDFCPTCGKKNGDSETIGTFKYEGQEFVCPDDDFGHVRLRLAYNYWIAGIPLEYQTLIWDDYPHEEVKAEVDRYIDSHAAMFSHGIGWLVTGKSLGSGKSWTTTHILREMVKRGYSCWWVLFTDIVSLYNEPNPAKKAFQMDKMRESAFLNIDDVLKPVSDAQRHLYEDSWEEILRYRTNMSLPTLISTNLTEEEIAEFYPRIYSLLGAKQYVAELEGEDARLREVRQRNIAMAENGEVRPIV